MTYISKRETSIEVYRLNPLIPKLKRHFSPFHRRGLLIPELKRHFSPFHGLNLLIPELRRHFSPFHVEAIYE